MGVSALPQGKQLNWKWFFLLAAEPMAFVGVGGCFPFLPVSCSAVLLWIHEGFPNKALEMATHFVTETNVTPQDVEPWSTCVTPRHAGAGPQGLGLVFTCEASRGERIHVALLTYCPYNLLQPTASQPAGKGWWQPCSSPLLCHQG